MPSKCIFCGNSLQINEFRCPSCGLSQVPRILVDWEIKTLLERDVITIEPILDLEDQINPAGVDLRLDTRIREYKYSEKESIDPSSPVLEYEYYTFKELDPSKKGYYILHPKEFILAQSFEYICLPDFIVGGLDGRSSRGRLGIVVHATAGSIDPGFKGHIIFELSNLGKMPVRLRPLERIGRLVLHLTEKCEKPYSGPYQYQSVVMPSRSFLDTDLQKLAKN